MRGVSSASVYTCSRVSFSTTFHFVVFETKSFVQPPNLLIRLSWAVQEPRDCSQLFPLARTPQCTDALCARDPNSGPHACVAST